jgi:hypothetical protein
MRPKPATLATAAATGTLMFTAPVLIPAITAAGIALAPLPLSPNPGDQCWNWHATAQDAAGQTMTCTHTPDSGHLMYWGLGGPRDSG